MIVGKSAFLTCYHSLIFVDIWLVVFQDVQKDRCIRTTSLQELRCYQRCHTLARQRHLCPFDLRASLSFPACSTKCYKIVFSLFYHFKVVYSVYCEPVKKLTTKVTIFFNNQLSLVNKMRHKGTS